MGRREEIPKKKENLSLIQYFAESNSKREKSSTPLLASSPMSFVKVGLPSQTQLLQYTRLVNPLLM